MFLCVCVCVYPVPCVCMCVCILSHHISSTYSPSASHHPISSSFLLVSLHTYISLLTDPLRCCQPRHLPFKCQQTHAICLYLSTKYRCVHLHLCVPHQCVCVSVCLPVYAFMCLCAPFYVCLSGLMVSDEVASSLNRGAALTIYLTAQERKKTKRQRVVGEGSTQHLSFNKGSNNGFF